MKVGLSKSTLIGIVEASVEKALELSRLEDEAEREKARQASLEAAIDKTAGVGSERDSLELEKDAVDTGAPTRGQSLDVPSNETPPEKTQAAPEKAQQQKEEITSDALIDKFNIIRSGRSMNDRDISAAIKKFTDSMKPEQRSAFFNILSQIGKIVAPTVDSSRLTKPPEEPTAVQNARLQMLQKRRQDSEQAAQKRADDVSAVAEKPAPQRAPEQPAAEPEREEVEDTSPPIRVGKRTAESLRVRMKQLLQD